MRIVVTKTMTRDAHLRWYSSRRDYQKWWARGVYARYWRAPLEQRVRYTQMPQRWWGLFWCVFTRAPRKIMSARAWAQRDRALMRDATSAHLRWSAHPDVMHWARRLLSMSMISARENVLSVDAYADALINAGAHVTRKRRVSRERDWVRAEQRKPRDAVCVRDARSVRNKRTEKRCKTSARCHRTKTRATAQRRKHEMQRVMMMPRDARARASIFFFHYWMWYFHRTMNVWFEHSYYYYVINDPFIEHILLLKTDIIDVHYFHFFENRCDTLLIRSWTISMMWRRAQININR